MSNLRLPLYAVNLLVFCKFRFFKKSQHCSSLIILYFGIYSYSYNTTYKQGLTFFYQCEKYIQTLIVTKELLFH